MTLATAMSRAVKFAKAKHEPRYVIYSPEEYDTSGPYHVADEIDLDTFFFDARIYACVESTGAVDYADLIER